MATDYKNTLNLPRTDFPMKADLVARQVGPAFAREIADAAKRAPRRSKVSNVARADPVAPPPRNADLRP